ncbi:hypothetical protein [Pendulispora albinea]|uniref:Uncharacterized protein n=1 Tax=Pendulispora albinea TaxID=2741071 RepID=A0ABZ2MAS1_9BACT
MGFLVDRLGIRLLLLMGATIPVPAPAEVVRALTEVRVVRHAGGRDGFTLTFSIGKDKSLDYALTAAGATGVLNRVVIVALLGAVPDVLIDGVITLQQHIPDQEPGRSRLVVTGTDLMTLLDLEEKNAEFPAMPDFAIVQRILAGYPALALAPVTVPTSEIPIPFERIPRQAETDLAFIHRLAHRNGYVFYIDSLSVLANTAYFGPETRLGLPQPALSMDSGMGSNVASLSFTQDGLAPVAPSGTFFEPITKTVLPIPPLPSLRIPPLSSSPTPAARKVLLRDAGNKSPGLALSASVSAVSTAPPSVTGTGQVDTAHYGSVLHIRRPVGVRGAGRTYDGLYYVQRVTHQIDVRHSKYTQDFTLTREGTGSLLPAVPP